MLPGESQMDDLNDLARDFMVGSVLSTYATYDTDTQDLDHLDRELYGWICTINTRNI